MGNKDILTCLGLLASVLCVTLAADESYIRSTLTNHFSTIRNVFFNNTLKNQARDFIYSEFMKFGLDTTLSNFTSEDYEGTFTNVIGVLPGTNFGKISDKPLGLVANYDTAESSPGVDDNGSGMAALLAVAKSLTEMNKNGYKRNYTIIFFVFDMEEYNNLGSEKVILSWINPWLRSSYGKQASSLVPYGLFVLDSIMEYSMDENSQLPPQNQSFFETYFPETSASIARNNWRGDFIWSIYRNPSVELQLKTMFKKHWDKQKRPQYAIEEIALPFNGWEQDVYADFLSSSHRNLWLDMVPALYLTDSGKLRGKMIQCHRQPCDNKEAMLTAENMGFLAKIVDTLTAATDELSERSALKEDQVNPDNGTGDNDDNSAMYCQAGYIPSIAMSVVVLLNLLL